MADIWTYPRSLSKARGIVEAATELERELGVRSRCYAGWIQGGKISTIDAVDRYERMIACLRWIEAQPAYRVALAAELQVDIDNAAIPTPPETKEVDL